jgi:hypothetical protein
MSTEKGCVPPNAVEPEAPPTPQQIEARFPPLDKGAKCYYDTEARAMWVGLPIQFVDPFGASVFLDASKLEFVKHHQREVLAEMERRKSPLGRLKDSVGAMMGRLQGKPGTLIAP